MPDWVGTVVDPPSALVVTAGSDDGVVTETLVRGVVAVTVVVGTVVGTVVDTVGAIVGTVVDWMVGTVVGTVGTVVGTVGTVVGTVGTVVGTVTVAPPGAAVASTFATKKPDTAKQTSTTIILHFTTFISPSTKMLVRSKNCLHLQPFW